MTEVEQALQKNIARQSQNHGAMLTTDRSRRLAEYVGSPHRQLKVAHVAGTSGKTSTSYFMASLLGASGASVGLTVSPHIDSLTERVQVNGAPLDEKTFCAYFSEFSQLIEGFGETPSYFEFLLVFALWVFAREQVEYAVLETGLGGLYDSTNICRESNKVCIITDIGLDHTEFLGDTLGEIAAQKAGIIAPDNDVFMYQQSDDVMRTVEASVRAANARLHAVAPLRDEDMPPTTAVQYQQRNWGLAYQVYRFIAARDTLPQLTLSQQSATISTHVPGRMDTIGIGDKTLVLDGAHNQQKLTTFFASFRAHYPSSRPVALLALKQTKDVASVASVITQYCDAAIITTFTKEQDMPTGAHEPANIADMLRGAGLQSVHIEPNPETALGLLIDLTHDVGIVIGSFFLVAEIRRLLAKNVV